MLYANEQEDNKPVRISKTYFTPEYSTKLIYSHTYLFRVRMSDISGGGPKIEDHPETDLPGQVAIADFKRYVAPNSLLFFNPVNDGSEALAGNEIKTSTDGINFDGDELIIGRPLLGYPSVVYTNKYIDAVAELKKVSDNIVNNGKGGYLGIPDPDVVKIEIKVEVETLQLDNLASDDGKEHFITLYKIYRNFPEGDYNAKISLGIIYKDVPVLNLEDQNQPFGDAAADATISENAGGIVLPTSRTIRLSIRAICEGDDSYWGNTSNQPKFDTRYGKITTLTMRRESKVETNLLLGKTAAKVIQGIYLQPDPTITAPDPTKAKNLQGGEGGIPDIVHRLGKQIDVAVNKMTLAAENGERIQFWCSNMIRHTLAPDNSSITFANKSALTDQWIVFINLYVNRDWTWDALNSSSFSIYRRRGNDKDTIGAESKSFIGDLEMRRIASFQSIQQGEDEKIHREYTRIVFIDVLDMKPVEGKFPNETVVQYTIATHFKEGQNPEMGPEFSTKPLELPTTINPVQVPKVINAGVALSPYIRNEKYSATEARQRYLWLEFDSLPLNPDDGLFARVLAHRPRIHPYYYT
jgi:hypothetical protein